ncbi:probable WRKY transcription factor 2 isoform X2 [Malus sylvestris]|uniref:probable WRKY transcription factor 2 isoform X2 n=1 Tax=Malus sylvestris TaxID=3752 RepID=UPI0021AD4EC4|nr:probable WRKY transcription factor 2 isoform X2 [Malus sylvestris]
MEQEDDAVTESKADGGGGGGGSGGARSGISIAERRAAKCGFNAERINTVRVSTTNPLNSPTARSPCLTIPSGISPTALLDSPVMVPNSQALPSPTTGTFPLRPPNDNSLLLKSGTREDDGYRPAYSSFENQGSTVDYQALVLEQQPMEFSKEANATDYAVDPSTDVRNINSGVIMNANSADLQMSHSSAASDQNSLPKEAVHGEDMGTHQFSEGEHKGSYSSAGMVKKKVERSYDGQITEIIYKGAPHNHAKPQPNRRAGASVGPSFSYDDMSEMGEGSRAAVKVEGGPVWTDIQSCKDRKVGYDGRPDGLERTSSASVVTELSDPFSTTQGKSMNIFESAETPELSSTLASHDDDDRATQGSISLGDDADDEESDSKRRKKESCMIETNFASRDVRKPRVVVQIESEIDILDDGYRWRKYGQKVVKGNPNPRSYYKCTSAGCSVRKHVERASHDLKFVITAYEGKHNHEVPAARNSNHMNSSSGNGLPSTANAQPALALPRNTNIPKPETQVQDLAPHFDRKPEFHDKYMRTSFLGNFSNDMKFGAPSLYQMKYPPPQNTMLYASFGMHANHNVAHQAGSVVPDFPISLPMSLPPSGNLPLASYGFNNGKSVCPEQPYFSRQQLQEIDVRFLQPKQEHKDDNLYDACFPTMDRSSAALSSSSLFYHRVMGGYPS